MQAPPRPLPPLRRLLGPLLAALALAGCGHGSSQTPVPQTLERPARDSAPAPAPAPSPDAAASAAAFEGIRGQVEALEGSPEGEVLVAIPNSDAPARAEKVDAAGRFQVAGLLPSTYRLILPADGVHATAELYVTVDPATKTADTTIHRSRGCPVKIVVRDQGGEPVAGAELSLALSDLPQVPRPRVAQGTTGQDGLLVLVGSCVRGVLSGTVRAPGRSELPVEHGYVGQGWDTFDVILPAPTSDAGVTYANDE